MQSYLINGPSGSGKSTIGEELIKRGYKVIFTDKAFGCFANLANRAPVEFPGIGEISDEWYRTNGWFWNHQKVLEALNNYKGTVFFCGGATNESEYYDCFQKIFYLHADEKIIIKRLMSRRNNPTNNPLFIKRTLCQLKSNKENDLLLNMIVINTGKLTIQESVNLIIKHIEKPIHPIISFLKYNIFRGNRLIKKIKKF